MTDHDTKPEADQQVVVVTFQLGSQTYALPISPVRQIIEMVKITPLPQVSDIIVGVINFHGVLVPVINMRRLLCLEEIPLQLHTPIILVNLSERLVGLIVDKVVDVIGRSIDQVIDPNKILLKEMGEAPLLQGLIQAEGRSILLLNPEHLFKPYQSRALAEAIQTQIQSVAVPVPTSVEVTPVQRLPLPEKKAVKQAKTSRNRRHKEVAVTPNNGGEAAS